MPSSRMLYLAAALALALTACGGADEDGGSGGSGGGGGPSVEIMQPADGDSLQVPFSLVVESSEELGTTDEGLHHVHVYFDGNDDTYEVIETPAGEEIEIGPDSPAMEGVEPGEHTLDVSLRHADHSAAGAEDSVDVMIGSDGSTSGSDSDSDSDDGGPIYDY